MLHLSINLPSKSEEAFLNIAKERNLCIEKMLEILIMQFLENLQDTKIRKDKQ